MYDWIVVGAGTAGSVLTEGLGRGSTRVLLLEAGGRPSNPFVKVPAGFAKLFKTRLDWAFESEPGAATRGRRVFIPRGKMLGGSSNMNAQVHQWCHPEDFDGWVRAGATGWAWEDVRPSFVAQENWIGEEGAHPRGRSGPMTVSPGRNPHPLARAFVEAARSAGLGGATSYNGGAYEGAWLAEVAHRNGRRFSAYDAFLMPAMARKNVEVMTKALVARILVEAGRAVGVVVRRGNNERTYRAARGVVLAAGAIGSPHVLCLSGIGPAETLKKLGVTVVHDAPEVGHNLQDHPLVATTFRTRRTDTLKNAESPRELIRYLLFQRGMLASNAAEAIAFARSGQTSEPAPDLELILAPFEWRNEGLEPPNVHAFTVGVGAVFPKSRGTVVPKSPDPAVAPAIDLGLFNDPDGSDARVMIAGIRLARRVAATPPLGAEMTDELSPGTAATSDADLRAFLDANLQTIYHPSSTCRMGSDARSVVDPDLRVRGVSGLWVADASVMPTVPRGHPNAVVAMIAGRAVERLASAR